MLSYRQLLVGHTVECKKCNHAELFPETIILSRLEVRALITSVHVQVEHCGIVMKITLLIFSLFVNH